MQAVILAAGVGSRLAAVSGGLPKCLLTIGNRPLIEHQLEALADAGIGKILVVIGHRADEVRAVVGNRAEFVENSRYKETNSLYSLWLARTWVDGPFVLINSDLLFHPDILGRLLAKGGNALAFDASSAGGREQTKVFVRDGRVQDIGKDLSPDLTHGESLGLLLFNAQGARALLSRASAMVKNGGEKCWVIDAIRSMCSTVPIAATNVTGLPWAEIDFPFDLGRARKEIWPLIERARWKKAVFWRKTRWLALAISAGVMIAAGMLISAQLADMPVDWVTMNPAGNGEVFVSLPAGMQTWWMTTQRKPLQVQVVGPANLRAEMRLLSAGEMKPAGRYVVQLSVNGEPIEWAVFKATRDPEAVLGTAVVGDRDRIEFSVAGGQNVIEILLLAGVSDSMLARLRNAEPASTDDDNE